MVLGSLASFTRHERRNMNTLDHTTEFDRWYLRARAGEVPAPEHLEILKNMADSLHGAWLAVKSEFGEKAQPEHALALLAIVCGSPVRQAGSTPEA